VAVNLFIVMAVFLSGTYLSTTEWTLALFKTHNAYIQKSLIWALSLAISLPFLIAAYRKIKALSMLLGELSIKVRTGSRLTHSIRRIISEVIPILLILITMLFIFMLSATILPPIELLPVILIFTGILVFFVWPWFIRLHSRLQVSLMRTLKRKPGIKGS
jgi:CPA2 family monovalent cation:H+ antiporter-2